MNWKEFEDLARSIMTRHFGVELIEKNPEGFPKKFDMVSNADCWSSLGKLVTQLSRVDI